MLQADEDTVTLRDVADAHGVYAVYGVPVDPVYMLALPVLFRAVLSGGGGDDEAVFLVNQRGAIVPAGEIAVGELIGYYRAGHDQEAYIQQLTAAAQAAGRALHERLYPRPVAVIPPPLDGNDNAPRRSRRRRRRAADIPTDIDAAATA